MNRIMLEERVNGDGILHFELPLGPAEAGRDVRVTVETIEPKRPMTQEEWQAIILEMAGSWQGEFERPDQGVLEERDPLP